MAENAGTAPRERAIRRPVGTFDAQPYRTELVGIIRDVEALLAARSAASQAKQGSALSEREVDRILKRWPRDGSAFFSRSQLVEGYRAFAPDESFAIDAQRFSDAVRMRRVRSLSGVTPVTVSTLR